MLIAKEESYKIDDTTNNQGRRKVEIFNTGHAMRIFAESTYTRPKEAVVRETIFNAVDASRGKSFDVTAPSLLDPNFKVRDFGVGMTEEFFLNEYAKVGYSTKRESNDEVGGFGQGRFAAFAYKPCDQFHVRGIKDGKFFLGSVWHDSDFEIFVQIEDRGDTTEENGVEVIIPVLVADHADFRQAIQIFTEFVPTANSGVERLTRKSLFEAKDGSWKIQSFDPYDQNNPKVVGANVRAVMGGVPYKLDLAQVFRYDTAAYLNVHMADLIFPIGSLAVPASREELRYDEATKKVIVDKFVQIKKDLLAEVAERQKTLKSDFERWTDPSIGAYEAALGNNLRKTLETRDIPDVEFIQGFDRIREFEGRSRVIESRLEISPKRHYLVYVIDTPLWRQKLGIHALEQLKAWDAAEGKKVGGIVIALKSDKAINLKLGDAPYVKTSTLPDPPKIPRQKVVLAPGTAPVAVARVPKMGTWGNGQWNMQTADFTQKDVVYIPLKITQLKEGYTSVWENILGTTTAKTIMGVPEADLKLAQAAGWKDVKDWVKGLFTPDVLEAMAMAQEWGTMYDYHGRVDRENLLELLGLFKDGYKLPQQYKELQKKLEIIGTALSIEANDLKTRYKSLIKDTGLVVPEGSKYKVKAEFNALLKSNKVMEVMLQNNTFSALRKAKVDVPTILAIAKKAL